MNAHDLSPIHARVLDLLRAADDGTGNFPTTEEIGQRAGLDEAAVEAVLDELERLRLIDRAGPFAEYTYRLVTGVLA